MRAQGALTKGAETMFGLKARKARKGAAQAQAQGEERTYGPLDHTPHGVAVLFPHAPAWVRPAAWQPSRRAAEDIAAQMLREHPEWRVEVVRK